MRTRLLGVTIAIAMLSGCTLTVKYPPPMRRHVEPMFLGKMAVLIPKIASEDGQAYVDIFKLEDYDRELSTQIAAALQLTGISEDPVGVSAKAEDLLAFAKSAEGKKYDYILVSELTTFDNSVMPSPAVIAYPWSLVGFIGVPIWFGTSYGTASLNLQLIDVPTGVTLLTANPKVKHHEEWLVGMFDGLIYNRPVRSFANAIHEKLIDQIRLDLEREMLKLRLAPDARVVPDHMRPGGKSLGPSAKKKAG